MKLSLTTINNLIGLVNKDINSLNDHVIRRLSDDPDAIDTKWFEDKTRQKEKMEGIRDELHAYKRSVKGE